jgi:hypothetical protein
LKFEERKLAETVRNWSTYLVNLYESIWCRIYGLEDSALQTVMGKQPLRIWLPSTLSLEDLKEMLSLGILEPQEFKRRVMALYGWTLTQPTDCSEKPFMGKKTHFFFKNMNASFTEEQEQKQGSGSRKRLLDDDTELSALFRAGGRCPTCKRKKKVRDETPGCRDAVATQGESPCRADGLLTSTA